MGRRGTGASRHRVHTPARTTAIFTLNRVWKPARLMLIARVVSGNN